MNTNMLCVYTNVIGTGYTSIKSPPIYKTPAGASPAHSCCYACVCACPWQVDAQQHGTQQRGPNQDKPIAWRHLWPGEKITALYGHVLAVLVSEEGCHGCYRLCPPSCSQAPGKCSIPVLASHSRVVVLDSLLVPLATAAVAVTGSTQTLAVWKVQHPELSTHPKGSRAQPTPHCTPGDKERQGRWVWEQ
jgi:hypothetical protein